MDGWGAVLIGIAAGIFAWQIGMNGVLVVVVAFLVIFGTIMLRDR